MRFLILLVAIVFSFSLVGGETYEVALPDDFAALGWGAKWKRIEEIVKERHAGLAFIYCAAAVFHPGVLRYAFHETETEAHDAGIELFQPTNPQNTLHVFPRVRVLPPRAPMMAVVGQASH